ncbi:MAG: SpoIIE family protein phosphatase [Lachnospiraceae bacterium]|nr:SpoIIE family protein phosphatase [Lachnospiraceae bacterium]
MKQHKLMNKILLNYIIMAVILMASLSLLVSLNYRSEVVSQYRSMALSYAKTAAAYIDGDRVAEYLETGEKDEYYQEVMDFLNLHLENSDMQYLYVIIPEEDDFVYVWDADSADEVMALGEHEDYFTDGKEVVDAAFSKEPEIRMLYGEGDLYGYIVCLFYPIYDSAGEPVALVGVDLSVPEMNRKILSVTLMIICCIVVIVLLSIVFCIRFMRKNVEQPIRILSETAQGMVEHLEEKDTPEIPIHTQDEIEGLARAFEGMHRELAAYIQRLYAVTAEKERVGAELSVAARIQEDMLPSIFPPFPNRREFDLFASMNPAKEVGGDFYDFFLVDEDHLALVIADVSGKGVPAAMFMVIAKTLIKNAAQAGFSPKEVLEKVNNQLCENNESGMFVTVWLGILTISEGSLICANAGHEFPAIRRNGSFELFRDRHGLVLAGMENSRYREYEVILRPGDAIFVYTDGVPEAASAAEEQFGTERMLQTLNRKTDAACSELLAQVQTDIDLFVGEAPQFDDITMLTLYYRGGTAGKTQPEA